MMSSRRALALLIRLGLASGLGLSLAPVMHAQYGGWCGNPVPVPTPPPPPPPPPRCQPRDPCRSCSGSPCYVASGAYVTGAQDLLIRTNGFPLDASRNYRSTHAIDGPMGFGWTSTATSRLYYAVYLLALPSTYQKQAFVLMPDGSGLTFTDNGNGTFTPPQGRNDTLSQNGDGTFDLILQRTRSRLHFAADGSLQTMTDDYGNTVALTYDGGGRVQQIADASGSGRYLNVFWGADGRISAIQDSSGRQLQYAYTAQGALASATDAVGRITTYSYTQGRFEPLLSRIADSWNRVITDVTYDTADRVRTYTENGEIYTYTYAYQGNAATTAKADSLGNTYTYPFSAAGYVTDRTPPAGGGGTTHTTYYPDGSVQQFTDGVGVKTYYTYTADGSPLTITRDYQGATAIRFDYAYDPNFPDKVTAITPRNPSTGAVDPNWQAWRYDYYQAGDPAPGALHHVYRVESDGATLDTLATYEYDSHGRVTKQTSPTGGVTDYAYDAQGNLATATAPANNDPGIRPATTYGYDSLGRATSVTDPLNHVTTYTYDALDRVATVTLPKPSISSILNFTTTYGYDNYDSGTGLVFTIVTDPNGQITRQGYDQYGQLAKSIDASNNATTYGYTRGLLTSLTDANGNVTTYAYDPGRRLTSATFPDSAVERYTYTADSLLYQKTDRKNQMITYAYDRFKRLASKSYPNSTSIAYTYQGQKLTQVVDSSVSPTETHTFAYDSSYRLQSETQATRGTITRTFNPDDTAATTTVQNGPTATYSYYPDGSLNTIAWSPVSGNFKYAYTLAGQYQSIAFPNGATRNLTYDDQGRMTQISNFDPVAGNLATYAYGYDLNYTTGQYTMLGQRVSLTATVPSQGLSNHLTKYEYDPLYQLNKVTYPNVAPLNGEVDSWTHDAIGNRLTATVNGSTQTYTYQKIGANPNNWQRLLSDGSSSYTYDANGSTATKSGVTFGWNADNRMTSISGATAASYLYDYQGRRSSKSVGATTGYLYDGLNLVQEQGAGPADYLFGPGIDEPLAMSRGGQIYYYATDALGSVTAITNSSGAVQNTYLYDAWGQVKAQTGSLANPFTYTSREVGEVGLGFYRARYLQPSIGRMISEDPYVQQTIQNYIVGYLDDPDYMAAYPYAFNMPVQFRDPMGLCPPGKPCREDPKDPCKKPECSYDQCTRCCIKTNEKDKKECQKTGSVSEPCKRIIAGTKLNGCLTLCEADWK